MKFVMVCLVALLAGCAGSAVTQQDQSHAQNSAKLHTELAGMYYERGQMAVALTEIDLALKLNKDYAPAYNVRGLINMSLREDKEAEADFLNSLRLDNKDSDAQNNYGWFLCQRGREMDSIAHFMVAVKNPLYATPERSYLNAGICFKRAGKSQDAEEFLQRALRIRPNLLQGLMAMAELKFAAADYPAASKYFASLAENNDSLSAAQLLLGVRIEQRVGNRNAEASYALQLREHFPDARETQLLIHGE